MNAPSSQHQLEAAYLARLGERVRALRTQHAMTRKNLAEASGVSERYLAQLESGRGNISILLLRKVGRAMGVPLERLVHDDESAPRTARIALIGLRGAGKSTLGGKLAQALGVPFIELDEGQAKACGEFRSQGRLARAAQADERDAPPAAIGVLAHQRFRRHVHRPGELAQQQHRDVALAGLELRQVALRDAGGSGEGAARGVVLGAPGAHAFAEAGEVGGFLLGGGERGIHEDMNYIA